MKLCPTCQTEYGEEVEFCPADGMKLRVRRDEQADPLVGRALDDRWIIEEKLGEGGMGAVYKGHQRSVNRTVAIKTLRPQLVESEEFVNRFFREAQIAANIAHPNCVTILDYGEAKDGTLYLAMEFLDGELLTDRIETGELTVKQVLEIGIQVASALSAAHDQSIVHRDLKPDNIFLLDVPGGATFVKVLDFGIAKMLDSNTQVTKTGMIFGTPEYMSPEQCRGDRIDGRSDLYALGCILYELVGGRTPFRATTPMAVLMAHVNEDVPGLPATDAGNIPPGLERIIMRLLEKRPENRPESAAKVRAELEAELQRLENPSAKVTAPREIVAPSVNIGFDETVGFTESESAQLASVRTDTADVSPADQSVGEYQASRKLFYLMGAMVVAVLVVAGAVIVLLQEQTGSVEPAAVAAASAEEKPPVEETQETAEAAVTPATNGAEAAVEASAEEDEEESAAVAEARVEEKPPRSRKARQKEPQKTEAAEEPPQNAEPKAEPDQAAPAEPEPKAETKPEPKAEPAEPPQKKKKRRRGKLIDKINKRAEEIRDDTVKKTDKALEDALDGLMGE